MVFVASFLTCVPFADPNKGDMGARKDDTPQKGRTKYELIGFAVAGVVVFLVLCLVVTYFVRRKRKTNKQYSPQNNYPSVSTTKSMDRYSVEMKEKTPFLSLFTRKEKERPVFKSARV